MVDGSPRKYVGHSTPRVENLPLLTGAARFVDDIDRPGQLHARVVRSETAHGRVTRIDVSRARRHPGVVDVVTGDDLPDLRIPVRLFPSEEAARFTQRPLARGTVRYVGEPIAVVVATDAYVAEDAAAEIEVEIEELAPVRDVFEAISDDSPRLHGERADTNVMNTLHQRWGDDIDALFERAGVVVRDRLRVQRHAAIPIETRGLVAEFDAESGRMTVWGPTKVKHFNRAILAGSLQIPEDRVRLVEPEVGGGFGARGEFYPEDFLVPWLAMRLGRPVKWIEDRREHFVAINHSRETWCDIEVAAEEDGRLVAMRAQAWCDQGAYARTHGVVLLPWGIMRHLPGPYRWSGFDLQAHAILTNKTPSGTYRGPTQYEATFFRERMMDKLAARLGMDPVELRRRNLIALDDMPFVMEAEGFGGPLAYDAGDFPTLFETAITESRQLVATDEVERRRAAGDRIGVGVAAFIEEGIYGPHEFATVVPEPDGRFTVYAGVASVGQGIRTVLGQLAAEALGVPPERIDVHHHDTDLVPEGVGAFASRGTVVGGGAVLGAVADLREQAVRAAAERLGRPADELEFSAGAVHPVGTGDGVVAPADLGVQGHCKFEKARPSIDMGACVAVAAVDPQTGGTKVLHVLVCKDIGQAVNPRMVDGQLVGGAVQGVGGALLEDLAYDDNGQPLSTSFMDYLMATAAEAPQVVPLAMSFPHHDPATETPLGMRSAGESGVVGVGGAVANAVAAAIGGEAGTAISALPITPGTVHALLRGEAAT